MILRRLGNKKKLAQRIISYFPKHSTYIEPFFGAGGLFFNKPVSEYNILNDYDEDVYNIFTLIRTRKDELWEAIETTPLHEKIWKDYKEGRMPQDDISRAIRFLMVSNFSLYGSGETFRLTPSDNGRRILFANYEATIRFFADVDVTFSCRDAVELIKSLSLARLSDQKDAFVYCDPPYQQTRNNYSADYTYEQLHELTTTLIDRDLKFAISEFENDVINGLADEFNLHKIVICERQTLKNRNNEVLLTNYKVAEQSTFF